MKFIILFFLVMFIFLLCLKSHENFNIRLEKAHGFYVDYRNFIDGNDHLLTRNKPNKRQIPYKISPNCFADKYRKCLSNKSSGLINEKVCEDDSLNQCVLPVMMGE